MPDGTVTNTRLNWNNTATNWEAAPPDIADGTTADSVAYWNGSQWVEQTAVKVSALGLNAPALSASVTIESPAFQGPGASDATFQGDLTGNVTGDINGATGTFSGNVSAASMNATSGNLQANVGFIIAAGTSGRVKAQGASGDVTARPGDTYSLVEIGDELNTPSAPSVRNGPSGIGNGTWSTGVETTGTNRPTAIEVIAGAPGADPNTIYFVT